MNPNNDIHKVLDYCQNYAFTGIENNAIPFGEVIDSNGELLDVDCQKDLPEAERLSHKSFIDTLFYHLGRRLFSDEISAYAITYYGKGQINIQGEQSDI
jgi:hypothetical protein